MVKTYIAAPNLTTAPDGAIKLGHILCDLTEFVAINRHSIVPFNQNPVDTKVGFTTTRAKLMSGELGVFAKILGVVGLGVDAGVSGHRSDEDILSFAELDTVTFDPTDEYVGKAMKLPEVEMFLKTSGYKSPVYIITGLKIGRQGSMNRISSRGLQTTAQISAGPPGTTVESGTKLQMTRATSDGEAFTGSTDFIVAFRVRKVTFKRGQLRHEAYTSKAVMQGGDKDDGSTSNIAFETSDHVSLEDIRKRAQHHMHEELGGPDDPDTEDGEILWILPNSTDTTGPTNKE